MTARINKRSTIMNCRLYTIVHTHRQVVKSFFFFKEKQNIILLYMDFSAWPWSYAFHKWWCGEALLVSSSKWCKCTAGYSSKCPVISFHGDYYSDLWLE